MRLIVKKRFAESDSIFRYTLTTEDETDLPPFEPGAHIELLLNMENGEEKKRCYSLINYAGHHPKAYEIAVLRQAEGTGGSRDIHKRFLPGTRIEVSMPRNFFPLLKGAKKSILVAGGIGITPLLAMARHFANKFPNEAELHYYCKRGNERAFARDLAELNLASVRQRTDVPRETIRQDIEQLIDDNVNAEAALYVCGPPGFINLVVDRATAKNWPAHLIQIERFSAVASSEHGFNVRLARSDRVVPVPPGRSLLQMLNEAGCAVPSSCEIGVCGSCIVKVLSGEVAHSDDYLSDAEREEGQMCACVSRGTALVLDL